MRASGNVSPTNKDTGTLFRFNGADYEPSRDDVRLSGQLSRIWRTMSDGRWRTLSSIAAATSDPESSISAQLRHLRKPRFGLHTIDRRHVGNGLYEYRLEPNPDSHVEIDGDGS